MGQEAACTLRIGRKVLAGKAQLEGDHILFREERIRLSLEDRLGVAAEDGVLRVPYEGGTASLELGKAAGKWADRILHPPTLLDKLGVKPGVSVALVGRFDAPLVSDARPADAEIVLYAAPDRKALGKVKALARSMGRDAALWIVYPKGVQAIREREVIEAGRAAGLKDVKVASFSATHTALKFVVPVAARNGWRDQSSR